MRQINCSSFVRCARDWPLTSCRRVTLRGLDYDRAHQEVSEVSIVTCTPERSAESFKGRICWVQVVVICPKVNSSGILLGEHDINISFDHDCRVITWIPTNSFLGPRSRHSWLTTVDRSGYSLEKQTRDKFSIDTTICLNIQIGSFFMINLCLVVIATQFSETKKRELERMKQERARYVLHPAELRIHLYFCILLLLLLLLLLLFVHTILPHTTSLICSSRHHFRPRDEIFRLLEHLDSRIVLLSSFPPAFSAADYFILCRPHSSRFFHR